MPCGPGFDSRRLHHVQMLSIFPMLGHLSSVDSVQLAGLRPLRVDALLASRAPSLREGPWSSVDSVQLAGLRPLRLPAPPPMQ